MQLHTLDDEDARQALTCQRGGDGVAALAGSDLAERLSRGLSRAAAGSNGLQVGGWHGTHGRACGQADRTPAAALAAPRLALTDRAGVAHDTHSEACPCCLAGTRSPVRPPARPTWQPRRQRCWRLRGRWLQRWRCPRTARWRWRQRQRRRWPGMGGSLARRPCTGAEGRGRGEEVCVTVCQQRVHGRWGKWWQHT